MLRKERILAIRNRSQKSSLVKDVLMSLMISLSINSNEKKIICDELFSRTFLCVVPLVLVLVEKSSSVLSIMIRHKCFPY